MKTFYYLFLLTLLTSCGVQHQFTGETGVEEDSSFVYALPYPAGTSHLLLQGYKSGFSHKGRMALDFKMKKGSPVTAAREGVVVRLEESFKKGGVNKKYLRKANQVLIRHNDGSQAY
ncbi:MAG: hypothetical protein ACXWV0_05370, partial [Flavisolibacter sp.]